MNRRDAIKSVAFMMGGTFSAPTLLAMNHWESNAATKASIADFTLTENQKLIVAEVAELIIPKTSTPGAKDTGVPAFIVMMLRDCYKQAEHISFVEGIKELEQKQFLSLNQALRTDILKEVERNAVEQMKVYQVQQTKMGDNEDREQMAAQAKGLPYWRLMKELTMLGYFTSEEGIKSSFEYVPIPGKLEMIKQKPNQKSFAY
ncbi:gluconate 2-dehydrogenase subunit 3 family protein [Dyadobacter sp. LHD-138]|uniref:gluconate 2-dehydrogenase subunit 3 family protein n=1 Tax=Dyadobacter sp. LHD-138 TaxID=3071413 RepID=UPI0027E0BAB1|nr:gluconate 2-dehydrogenase subunit 3 family protein [Dyadobacter sp. LHD-138]MDQ6479155.1 gluconate 2-dehydrogenase subunit 3 family protein [Dyadobacter sp. LHD-138]